MQNCGLQDRFDQEDALCWASFPTTPCPATPCTLSPWMLHSQFPSTKLNSQLSLTPSPPSLWTSPCPPPSWMYCGRAPASCLGWPQSPATAMSFHLQQSRPTAVDCVDEAHVAIDPSSGSTAQSAHIRFAQPPKIGLGLFPVEHKEQAADPQEAPHSDPQHAQMFNAETFYRDFSDMYCGRLSLEESSDSEWFQRNDVMDPDEKETDGVVPKSPSGLTNVTASAQLLRKERGSFVPSTTESSRIECPACNDVFCRPEHMRRHLSSASKHAEGKSHVCQFCHKLFSRRDNLSDHYCTHVLRDGRQGKNEKIPLHDLANLLGPKCATLISKLRRKLRNHNQRNSKRGKCPRRKVKRFQRKSSEAFTRALRQPVNQYHLQ